MRNCLQELLDFLMLSLHCLLLLSRDGCCCVLQHRVSGLLISYLPHT
jgi:hypothetical protein